MPCFITGGFLLVMGLLFIFSPKTIVRLDNWFEKTLFNQEGVVKRHILTGFFLLIVAALMFFWGFKIS